MDVMPARIISVHGNTEHRPPVWFWARARRTGRYSPENKFLVLWDKWTGQGIWNPLPLPVAAKIFTIFSFIFWEKSTNP
jgi:hypothetical protein